MLALLALLFSFSLMFHTFSYDTKTRSMVIASKAWSDFGAHIPLIRSFSKGANTTRLARGIPIESPLFPGEPIRYHFGLYALAGLLERMGVRIDWALNILSAGGFFLLLFTIYWLSYHMFKQKWVSILSVIFFLFNGSLSFLQFFKQHPLSTHSVTDIVTNSRFPVFGPWDNGAITAFWTLNIYTNQRHLALSYGIILTMLIPLIYGRHTKKVSAVITACLMSLLFFVNYAAVAIAGIILLWVFLSKPASRLTLFIAGILSLPAFIWLRHIANVTSQIVWQPGYLARDMTLTGIISFWIQNLGLHVLLIPIGLWLAPKQVRRLFLIPMLILFLIPNLFRFSPDMINNHKFFNFFVILGNMFTAYAVIRILGMYNYISLRFLRMPLKFLVAVWCIGLLTLSGIIDVFPVMNDTRGSIPDTDTSRDIHFFLTGTNPTDVITNSTWFYHPASLAGRAIYSGYTYFTWSYGYDQVNRELTNTMIYQAPDHASLCRLLTKYHISYVELNANPESYLKPNLGLWNSISPTYENTETHLRVFSTDTICRK